MNDVYSVAQSIFADCDDVELFARTSMAVNLARSKTLAWDAMQNEMMIRVDPDCTKPPRGLITFPRIVETPLAVTTDGVPSIARDKWFYYHINGPGSAKCNWQSCRFWTDLGEFPIIREIGKDPVYLIARMLSDTDTGKLLTIYGTDENDRPLYTVNADGTTTDGIVVPMENPAVATTQKVKTISRVLREPTNQPVNLLMVNTTTAEEDLLGYYEQTETQPLYRRVQVQGRSCVRLRYRAKLLPITSLSSFIPLNSENGLISMMRAMKFRINGQLSDAQAYEADGARLLNEEQDNRNAQSGIGPQIEVITEDQSETLYNVGEYWPWSPCGGGQGGGGNFGI